VDDDRYRLLAAQVVSRGGFCPSILERRLAQCSCHATGQRLDHPRKLADIGRNLLELPAELRLSPTGIASSLIDRRRGRLALLRSKPEQLASVGDVVLDEPVEPLVKGQALLQGTDLLGERFLAWFYVAR
jgi:hypothetical protein